MSLNLRVRLAGEKDRENIVDLLVRAKRLNEEFDPLLKLSTNLTDIISRYIDETLRSTKALLIVAEHAGRLVGVLKADLVDRVFYDPPLEGIIKELYILPEFRRKGVAKILVSEASKTLREKGAGLITAEFPSQHKIAVEFYEKMGFRPIFSKYAVEIDKPLEE